MKYLMAIIMTVLLTGCAEDFVTIGACYSHNETPTYAMVTGVSVIGSQRYANYDFFSIEDGKFDNNSREVKDFSSKYSKSDEKSHCSLVQAGKTIQRLTWRLEALEEKQNSLKSELDYVTRINKLKN